jgi:lipoprotein-anchoring transpeptidase ErfK/SrfK
MFKIFRTKIAIVGVALTLGGCAHVVPTTTVAPPKQPFLSTQPTVQSTVAEKRAQAVRMQIFLDTNHFRPGMVDGRPGEFFDKALALYNANHGKPGDEHPDVAGIEPYTTYKVTPEDLSQVGVMATDNAEVAKQKSCPYTNLGDVIAERFHTTARFLAAINPTIDINQVQAGQSLTVPNVADPFDIGSLSKVHTSKRDPSLAGRSIKIDVAQRILQVRDNDRTIASFPITPGSSDHPAPIGDWHIDEIATFPWFRYDKGVLERGERTEDFYNFPPGPRNPVGILWMQLNRPGDGIHGAPNAATIGRAGSHGCIRLANWDTALIRTLVTVGTPVSIQ